MSHAAPSTDCKSMRINTTTTLVDEKTGRTIRQLTDSPDGAHLGYFRNFKQLPGGRMLVWMKHEKGHAAILDPASGDLELVPHKIGALRVRETDGKVWFMRSTGDETGKPEDRKRRRELWSIDLPGTTTDAPCLLATLPDDLPGRVDDITIDGKNLILRETHEDYEKYPVPTTKDVKAINHFFSRPRHGVIWIYNLERQEVRKIHQTQDICPLHIDASPSDPELIRFCHDMPETRGQRIWTLRIDGSDLRKIRLQAPGEMVTHEFWWADPNFIGYTYQDRRQDPTVQTHHWAEYALAQTRLGIADLSGREVYLSDPLNSYHSHLYMSPDGRFVSGEGTHDQSFVYAARFDWKNPKLEMTPLATIHTAYIPFRGQGVDCNFSADGKWLLFANKRPGSKVHQIYAVEVDL